MRFTKTTLASSLLLGQASAALPPIIMKGSKFFYENGTQFYMKGIAYQQEFGAAGAASTNTKYIDPLADPEVCKRDVPLLKKLHTNTIRTYAIDPTKDHSACMKMLDDAGIYVVSDLSEPLLSVKTDDPHWDVDLLKRYTDVIDELAQYSNVIGFFAGNEVTTNNTNTEASAFVKAAVRDTKAHIKKTAKRWLGVGYAANDDPDVRAHIAHYFNCGDPEESIDFWGYNIYSWCGESSLQLSGYDKQIEFFQNYSVPVFFAEYGCNQPNGAASRIWDETTALYEKEMTEVFSGGIVYMYFQEANDYGVVKIQNGAAVTQKDFAPLETKVGAARPSQTPMDSYNPTNVPAACPAINEDWKVNGDTLPPTPDKSLCECMYQSAACQPAEDLSVKNYKGIFDFICGENEGVYCAGIKADATEGIYGAYSMCGPKEKLGHVLDAYYKGQKSARGACDFKGQAVINKSAVVADSCKNSLASASSVNNIVATATSAVGGGGAAAKSSNFAAPMPMKNLFTLGDVAVGLYVMVAMAAGAGMILL